jgi:hypothetical protein
MLHPVSINGVCKPRTTAPLVLARLNQQHAKPAAACSTWMLHELRLWQHMDSLVEVEGFGHGSLR